MNPIALTQGIHVQHLLYRIDRARWAGLPAGEADHVRLRLEALAARFPGPAHPRVMTLANVGGKADLGFIVFHATLDGLAQVHRDLEACFPPGTLVPVFSYLSVTELPEYVPTEDDLRRYLETAEPRHTPDSPEFEQALEAAKKRNESQKFYRLNPELQDDWPIVCFYPMSKKRSGETIGIRSISQPARHSWAPMRAPAANTRARSASSSPGPRASMIGNGLSRFWLIDWTT